MLDVDRFADSAAREKASFGARGATPRASGEDSTRRSMGDATTEGATLLMREVRGGGVNTTLALRA